MPIGPSAGVRRHSGRSTPDPIASPARTADPSIVRSRIGRSFYRPPFRGNSGRADIPGAAPTPSDRSFYLTLLLPATFSGNSGRAGIPGAAPTPSDRSFYLTLLPPSYNPHDTSSSIQQKSPCPNCLGQERLLLRYHPNSSVRDECTFSTHP